MNEDDVKWQTPIVDTKRIATEPDVYGIEIISWRTERGVTHELQRNVIGEYPTRRKADNAARKVREAVNDAYFAGRDSR